MEIEVIKKKWTEGVTEKENLGMWTGTTNTSITNSIQEIEKRILGTEYTIEEWINWSKEMLNLKNLWYKISRKSETPWKDQT